MLLTVPRKKSDYAPGEHPHSQDNLQPRETMYGEAKKRREVMVTATGWDGFKALAASMDLSASELVERLGRGTIPLEPPAFTLAVKAYADYCEVNNYIFQQPSRVDSEEKRGIIYLRNVRGPLARYSVKQGKILD
jgi:hypothetical protein